MIAQKITPRVKQWMRNSRSAHVLHVFEEVCTLVNERGEVISLVSPAIGMGPFTLMLESEFTSGLDRHQPVALDSGRQRLTVGALVVDSWASAVWQPRPDWSKLQGAAIGTWPPGSELPANIVASLKLIIDGIAANDSMTSIAGIEGLAGRGSGLTPTGDDVLVGILYGLWVWYPRHLQRARQEWMGIMRKTAVAQTTTLSANFIQAAANGEAPWQWHDLVNGRPHAIDRILSLGHTSGADAWAGFVYTGSMLNVARADGSEQGPASSTKSRT